MRRGEILLSSILPLDLTSLAAFAELHSIPWSAVTKAIKDYELFPERGNWRDGYRTVKVAIDERGCATFYEVFHGHARVPEVRGVSAQVVVGELSMVYVYVDVYSLCLSSRAAGR